MLFTFCILLLSAAASAQNQFGNSLQLSFSGDRLTPHTITRNYDFVPFGNDISPKQTAALGGQITYTHRLGERFSFGVGLLGGIDSDHFLLQINEEFAPDFLNEDFFGNFFEFSYVYGGLNLTAGYDLFQFKKSAITLNTGVSALFFLPTGLITSVTLGGLNNGFTVFANDLTANGSGKSHYLSVWELSYRHRLGERFFIGLGTNIKFTVAGGNYVEGTYKIVGQNETLTGSLTKRWISSGVNLHFGFVFNEKQN